MDQSKNLSVTLDGVEVKQKNTVKYLGVMLDKHLTFQDEVKNILRKMARGIKTLNAIKYNFPIATRITLMNALVLSHLHYSAILLSGISNQLQITLDKQINWAIKSCYNRLKYDSSRDLKIKHSVLPIKYLINFKIVFHLLKIEKKYITCL